MAAVAGAVSVVPVTVQPPVEENVTAPLPEPPVVLKDVVPEVFKDVLAGTATKVAWEERGAEALPPPHAETSKEAATALALRIKVCGLYFKGCLWEF